ncbi:MAG: PAS domain S-box protein [Sulfuritalea sp.]|nr:PAS domain S-box protein [Sulfuritalea sp.]
MDPALSTEATEGVPSMQSQRLARSMGKPVYSAPYPFFSNDWQFRSPRSRFPGRTDNRHRGRYLPDSRIARRQRPWWLAERYRISVVGEGRQGAGRQIKVESSVMNEGYQVAFDPPGWGLALHSVPITHPRPWPVSSFPRPLVVLATVVLWSLWILRRHVLRRQSVEEELRREHTFRKAMEDSLDTGMRARNLDGEITYVNPAFCRMVGWAAEELVGRRPPMPYWADEHLDETRAIHDRVLAGDGPVEGFELKFKRRNGEIIDVLIHETRSLARTTSMSAGWDRWWTSRTANWRKKRRACSRNAFNPPRGWWPSVKWRRASRMN